MKKLLVICGVALMGLLITACTQLPNQNSEVHMQNHDENITVEETFSEDNISDSYDYVLCSGEDKNLNYYKLVAKQTETSLGYEISVGVIKNGEWIYPLSSDFPFLGSDGLFHVGATEMWGDSGSDLSKYGSIAESIYFLDSGVFALEWTRTTNNYWTPDEKFLFFDCETFEIKEVYHRVCALREEANVDWNAGEIKKHGHIETDDGKLLLYSSEDKGYNWYLFDTETFEITTLASNIEIRPENVLAEGLIFAEDQCFYNISMDKVIDISIYDIVWGTEHKVYFENGKCTFETENELETKFFVTIDKNGNLISEVKQE